MFFLFSVAGLGLLTATSYLVSRLSPGPAPPPPLYPEFIPGVPGSRARHRAPLAPPNHSGDTRPAPALPARPAPAPLSMHPGPVTPSPPLYIPDQATLISIGIYSNSTQGLIRKLSVTLTDAYFTAVPSALGAPRPERRPASAGVSAAGGIPAPAPAPAVLHQVVRMAAGLGATGLLLEWEDMLPWTGRSEKYFLNQLQKKRQG